MLKRLSSTRSVRDESPDSYLSYPSIDETLVLEASDVGTIPRFMVVERDISQPVYVGKSQLDAISEYKSPNFVSIRELLTNITSIPQLISFTKTFSSKYIMFISQDKLYISLYDFYITNSGGSNLNYTYTKNDVKNFNTYVSSFSSETVEIPKVGNRLSINSYKDEVIATNSLANSIWKRMTTLDKYSPSGDEVKSYTYPESNIAVISKNGSIITVSDLNDIFGLLPLSSKEKYAVYVGDVLSYKVLPGEITPQFGYLDKNTIIYGEHIKISSDNSEIQYDTGYDITDLKTILEQKGYNIGSISVSYGVDISIDSETVDMLVFQDMILNNGIVSSYMKTKDGAARSGDISKIKMLYNLARIQVPGLPPRKELFTPVQINNYYISTKSIERKLLAISVKELKSEDSHKEFIRNFVNLVYYYLATSEKLIDQYSSFFGDDRINVITEVKDLELKRLLKPAYFNKDYSSKCMGPKVQPKIVSKKEVNSLSKEDRATSTLLLEDPDNREGDSPIPVYLSCHANEEYKYIYVKEGFNVCCSKSEAPGATSEGRKLVSDKTMHLNEGIVGIVPSMDDIFGTGSRIRRLGMKDGQDSFISSLETALKVKEIKKTAINFLSTSQYMQNMYDIDIKKYLSTEKFYDSDLVADGLSLLLQANIIIIEIVGKRSAIRIPRYKHTYFKTLYSTYNTVFIYRYNYDGKVYYEPIYSDEISNTIFGEGITKSVLSKLRSNYTYSYIDVETKQTVSLDLFLIKDNPDTYQMQILDSYGKLAGYVKNGISHLLKERRDPVIGKFTKEVNYSRLEDTPEGNDVTSLVLSRDNNNNLEWKSDVNSVELKDSTIPISIPQVIDPDGRGAAKRTKNILLQYISWLYILFERDTKEKFSSYLTTQPLEYKFPEGSVTLPILSFKEALNYVENLNSGLVISGKINLSSPAIVKGVLQFITFMRLSAPYTLPTRIYDTIENDENRYVTLRGEREKIAYEKTINGYYGKPIYELTKDMYISKSPILIFTNTKEMFILQNVEEVDSMSRAMNCVILWESKKTNSGYDTSVMDAKSTNEASKYVAIYILNEDMSLSPVKEESTMRIIQHGNKQKPTYSALLRID